MSFARLTSFLYPNRDYSIFWPQERKNGKKIVSFYSSFLEQEGNILHSLQRRESHERRKNANLRPGRTAVCPAHGDAFGITNHPRTCVGANTESGKTRINDCSFLLLSLNYHVYGAVTDFI